MIVLIPVCPSCGANPPVEKKFCTECGFNIEEVRQEKQRQLKIRKMRRGRAAALKNIYLLLLINGIMLLPILIAGRLDRNVNETMMVCSWIDAFLICLFIFAKGFDFSLIKKTSLKWAFLGVALCIPLLLLNFAYHGLIVSFFDIDQQTPFKDLFSSGIGVVWIFFYVALMPAIWEELMFRGLLLKELERIITPLEAAILSSVIFGVIHLSIFSLPYLAFLGFVLVLIRRKSNSLLPGIIVHFVHNAAIIFYELYL